MMRFCRGRTFSGGVAPVESLAADRQATIPDSRHYSHDLIEVGRVPFPVADFPVK